MKKRFAGLVAAVAAVLAFLLLMTTAAQAALLDDNFSAYSVGNWSENQTVGNWYDQFNGFGTQAIVASGAYKHLRQVPKASTVATETHAALSTSVGMFGNGTTTAEFTTSKQLRTKTPNAWERAWLLWHYTDNTHFYYVTLKANGWEVGKEDPAYPGAQQFLGSGSNYTWPVGSWNHVEVVSSGTSFTVKATDTGGTLRTLFSYTDKAANASQYTSGRIGLYDEDASVDWGWLAVV
ncbi:MAG TPA: hypothetical protein VH144_02940 [Candidatus Saccharimonadales bacterium]|jgi:hypothetical protein|nr:hypothetical protein [Candidatus Saccharimonadales bacterium]